MLKYNIYNKNQYLTGKSPYTVALVNELYKRATVLLNAPSTKVNIGSSAAFVDNESEYEKLLGSIETETSIRLTIKNHNHTVKVVFSLCKDNNETEFLIAYMRYVGHAFDYFFSTSNTIQL